MTTTSTVTVQQIHCDSCETTIRTGLGRLDGVRAVRPDAATNTVRVTYDEHIITEAGLRSKLADLGYDPVQ